MQSDRYKNKYRISSARLKYFDYSASGFYFVTICVKDMQRCFGIVKNGVMGLSNLGNIAAKYWQDIPMHFPFVQLDEFVIMPDHVHGVIKIVETQNFASVRRGNKFGPQSRNLASIVRGFKVGVKKWAVMNNCDFQWQERYYDRIIRNEMALKNIRKYIRENSQKY